MGSRREGPGTSYLGRRIRSSGLLLAGIALTAFIATAAATAVVTFSTQVLPRGADRQLARAPGMSMTVIGLVDARQAAADTRVIRARAAAALGGVPYRLDTAVWSDPLTVTAPGGRVSSGAEIASPTRVTAHASLVAGRWPASAGLAETALPAPVATRLGVSPGAVVAVRDSNTGARTRLRVTGVYRQDDPAAPYWNLDAIWTCGAKIHGCFSASGPMVVSPAAFGPGGYGVDQASWVLQPDAGAIPPADFGPLASRIASTETFLQQYAPLGGLVVSGQMPADLSSAAAELTAARSLLAIGALLLLLPAAGALALSARLLAARREEEHALLAARGATRWALASPALAESLLAGGAAVIAGVFAGTSIADLLARTGLLRDGGLVLSGIPSESWLIAVAAEVLTLAIVTWPVLRARPPGMVRVRRGRQAALAGAAEAGGDLCLLALAGLAVWQLHTYTPSGGTGVNPVVAAAPALALAAVSLIPMRLLPVSSRSLNWVAAASKRIGTAMASWEISRLPVRRAGPALLTVLAVATSTLVLASYASWRQSARDQAAFTTGADVRVDTPSPAGLDAVPSITRAPGVAAAMPAATADLGSGSLLALDSRAAGATVVLRPDLTAVPPAALWRMLTPAGPPAGIPLPGRPARLRLTARAVPPPRAATAAYPASALVGDTLGDVFALPAGSLPADGREHALTVTLGGDYPLRLIGLNLAAPATAAGPGGQVRPAVTAVAVSGSAAGPFAAIAAGPALAGWQQSVSRSTGTVAVTTPATTPDAIAGIATTAFLRANNAAVGAVFPAAVGAATIPVKIVAAVSAFPTATAADGALIVDLSAVQDYLTGKAQLPLPVASWWLRAENGATARPDMRAVPADAVVTDRATLNADLLGDSLAAAPQQAALAVGVAVTLLAMIGFAASVAASVRERRARWALLKALGVPTSAQVRQLCAEELVLSVPAAVAGLLAGALLARVLLSAVVLTPGGTSPVPPVLPEIPLGWAAISAAVICVLPAVAAVAAGARRDDTAAQLRGAEST